jgi:NAD(P)-dependent dehydrogenase (short-subunit alcohol dehydrogenase family)
VNNPDFPNKVALVTEAGSGIGREIALAFLEQEPIPWWLTSIEQKAKKRWS